MKTSRLSLIASTLILLTSISSAGQEPAASPEIISDAAESTQEQNKALARKFYEQVWFTRNTDAVFDLVAPEYVVHDIGDRKGVTEPAVEQKNVAEFFWQNGEMSGEIDYQIAEGDLVATRWHWRFKSDNWMMTALNLGSEQEIPIINVLRIKDGKIVEFWNHRHDIDTAVANFKFVYGFAAGLIPSVILLVISLVLWRKLRKTRRAAA
ncbi:MAG: ester cyclase [Acidobacteriota bacterium]|nr:MAG: ester cyclase [Acidobacteriota bacterium]